MYVLIIECLLWWFFVLPIIWLNQILLNKVASNFFLLFLVLNLTVKYHYLWCLLFFLLIAFSFYLHWRNRVKRVLFFCLYGHFLCLLNLVSKNLRPFYFRFIFELFSLAYSQFPLIYSILLTFLVTLPDLVPFLSHQKYTTTIFLALFPFVNFPIACFCLFGIVWIDFLVFWSEFCWVL